LIVRPATVGAEELYRYFSDAEALGEWLTRGGALGVLGRPAALTLLEGGSLSGTIIAATGREKSVTWSEEDDSVFELKGFQAGSHRMIGIRITTWGSDPDRLSRLERILTPAVERLAARFPK
jgi:hypothetical protein